MSDTADTVLSPARPQCPSLRHALCPWQEGPGEEGSSRNLALSPRSISRGSLLWFNISPAKAAFILHLNTMRSELPKALEKPKYRSQSRADFPGMRSTKNGFSIKSCKSPYWNKAPVSVREGALQRWAVPHALAAPAAGGTRSAGRRSQPGLPGRWARGASLERPVGLSLTARWVFNLALCCSFCPTAFSRARPLPATADNFFPKNRNFLRTNHNSWAIRKAPCRGKSSSVCR